jgi:hypothetical protein
MDALFEVSSPQGKHLLRPLVYDAVRNSSDLVGDRLAVIPALLELRIHRHTSHLLVCCGLRNHALFSLNCCLHPCALLRPLDRKPTLCNAQVDMMRTFQDHVAHLLVCAGVPY